MVKEWYFLMIELLWKLYEKWQRGDLHPHHVSKWVPLYSTFKFGLEKSSPLPGFEPGTPSRCATNWAIKKISMFKFYEMDPCFGMATALITTVKWYYDKKLFSFQPNPNPCAIRIRVMEVEPVRNTMESLLVIARKDLPVLNASMTSRKPTFLSQVLSEIHWLESSLLVTFCWKTFSGFFIWALFTFYFANNFFNEG